MNRTVIKNSIALFIIQIINYIVPIIILPYLTRVLGINGFGTISISYSVAAIALVVTDFGFNLSAPVKIINNINNKVKIAKFIGSIFVIKTVFIFFIIILLFLYDMLSKGIILNPLNLTLILAIIIGQTYLPYWFFQGIEKMKNVTIYMSVAKLSYLVLVLLFIHKQNQINLVLSFYAFSNIAAALIGIRCIYKEGFYISKPNMSCIKESLKESLQFFWSRAAVCVFTSANSFIIGTVSGPTLAALYSGPEKLYQAGQSATSPVSQALYPYLARTKNSKAMYTFIGICLVPLILICTFSAIFSQEILSIFYGPDFIPASNTLRVLMIALIFNFVSVNFGYPAFSIINRLDIANKSVIYGAFFQILYIIIMLLSNKLIPINISIGILVIEFGIMLYRIISFNILHTKQKGAQ